MVSSVVVSTVAVAVDVRVQTACCHARICPSRTIEPTLLNMPRPGSLDLRCDTHRWSVETRMKT